MLNCDGLSFREVAELASKLFSVISFYMFFDGVVVSIKQYSH